MLTTMAMAMANKDLNLNYFFREIFFEGLNLA
jgi:hypothetical protein